MSRNETLLEQSRQLLAAAEALVAGAREQARRTKSSVATIRELMRRCQEAADARTVVRNADRVAVAPEP